MRLTITLILVLGSLFVGYKFYPELYPKLMQANEKADGLTKEATNAIDAAVNPLPEKTETTPAEPAKE